jgi:hypothetical protein
VIGVLVLCGILAILILWAARRRKRTRTHGDVDGGLPDNTYEADGIPVAEAKKTPGIMEDQEVTAELSASSPIYEKPASTGAGHAILRRPVAELPPSSPQSRAAGPFELDHTESRAPVVDASPSELPAEEINIDHANNRDNPPIAQPPAEASSLASTSGPVPDVLSHPSSSEFESLQEEHRRVQEKKKRLEELHRIAEEEEELRRKLNAARVARGE